MVGLTAAGSLHPAAPGLVLGGPAHAQEAGAKPTLRVSRVILAEPEVETPLAISVVPESASPKQSYVRLRGLPRQAKLSDGHMIAPGAWAVPLAALSSLKFRSPLSGSGRSEVNIALMTVAGDVLAESVVALVVAPAWLVGPDGKARRAADASRTITSTTTSTDASSAATTEPGPSAAKSSAGARASLATASRLGGTARLSDVTPGGNAPQLQTAQAIDRPVAALPPPARVTPRAGTNSARGGAESMGIGSQPPLQTSPGLPNNAARPSPATQNPPTRSEPMTVQAPAPAVPRLTPEQRATADRMVERGRTFLEQGNFAAARQFFLRAADMGHAGGAMRLAATYDAAELAKLSVAGLTPDMKEARKWYELARQLGSTEAAERLSRLSASR